MKVKLSPLVSEISGKAGPIVGSRWKGIPYIRELVTPANPNSAGTYGQAEHRARMTMIIAWWHDMEQQYVDYCKTLASGLALSGFNAFVKRNLYDISLGTEGDRKTRDNPRMTPLNTAILPVATCVASTGSGSKELDVTWTLGEATGTFKAYILIGETDGDDTDPPHQGVGEKDTTALSALSTTITCASSSTWYAIAMMAEDDVNHKFSIALCDYAQSNA